MTVILRVCNSVWGYYYGTHGKKTQFICSRANKLFRSISINIGTHTGLSAMFEEWDDQNSATWDHQNSGLSAMVEETWLRRLL